MMFDSNLLTLELTLLVFIKEKEVFIMKRIIFLLICLISLLNCVKSNTDKEVEVQEVDENTEKELLFSDISFTQKEKEYIDSLKSRGYITASVRLRDTIYMPLESGEIHGYNYKLAKSFTDNIGVELRTRMVEFSDLFSTGGKVPEEVHTNPDYSYSPDLFDEVDFYIDTLTILPWRSKLVSFVQTIPTKILIVSRTGEEISRIEDLKGKEIVTLENSSLHTQFKKIEDKHNFSLDYIYEEKIGTWFKKISEGTGDVTARDANMTIFDLRNFDNLNVSIPISDVQMLAWAVKKDNLVFKSILDKYLDFARDSGLFNKYWMEDYSITLSDYLGLLDIDK